MESKYDNAMIGFLKAVAVALILAAAISTPMQLEHAAIDQAIPMIR